MAQWLAGDRKCAHLEVVAFLAYTEAGASVSLFLSVE